MTKIRATLAVSLDGFAAGPNQSAENPFGEGVDGRLHRWMFEDADANAEEIAGHTSATAYVMGRNMFGPGRGAWDLEWTGWWGPNPPYAAPVYVLTHHEREPVQMEGGTTFHFVTGGIESALEQARAAAGEGDVLIAGGAATVNQYLAAGADRRAAPARRAGRARRRRAHLRRRRLARLRAGLGARDRRSSRTSPTAPRSSRRGRRPTPAPPRALRHGGAERVRQRLRVRAGAQGVGGADLPA